MSPLRLPPFLGQRVVPRMSSFRSGAPHELLQKRYTAPWVRGGGGPHLPNAPHGLRVR